MFKKKDPEVYCGVHQAFMPCAGCLSAQATSCLGHAKIEERELDASEAITDKFPVFRKSTLKRTTVRDPRVEMPKVKK